MAAGEGSKRTQFKPGQSGNPGGSKKKDPMIREYQEMTYKNFINKLKIYGSMTRSEMQDVTKDKQTQVLDLIFCGHLFDAMKGKDRARESLYDRLWGRVKETDITAEFSAEHELMRRIPMIELIELARKYVTANEIVTANIGELSPSSGA